MKNSRLLVVARCGSLVNKFSEDSFLGAWNMKDFLVQTGEYEEVSVFQQPSVDAPVREWVKLVDVDR